MPLRVLFVAAHLPSSPSSGGNVLKSYNLIRSISQKHDIGLVSFASDPPESVALLASMCSYVQTVPSTFRRSIAGYLGTLPSRYPYGITHSFSQAMQDCINAAIRDFSPDVVHVDSASMAQYSFDRTLPAVVAPSDCVSFLFRSLSRGLRNPVRRMHYSLYSRKMASFERDFYSRFDAIVTVTERDMEELRRLLPNAFIKAIPNGVDTEVFSPLGLPPEPNSIVFVGTMSYLPNKDAALCLARQILPRILEQKPDVKLYIVGHNPDRDILALQGRQVVVTGTVDDVRPYVDRSIVFAAPLRFGAGIKNKVLEAMAMAKAVVAFPEALVGIGANEECGVFCVHGVDEFAGAVLRLLNDVVAAREAGQRARQYVMTRFSWSHVANEYEEVYRYAIATRRSGICCRQ